MTIQSTITINMRIRINFFGSKIYRTIYGNNMVKSDLPGYVSNLKQNGCYDGYCNGCLQQMMQWVLQKIG